MFGGEFYRINSNELQSILIYSSAISVMHTSVNDSRFDYKT